MAVQLSVGCRNAKLDAIETFAGNSCALEIRTLSQPANCAAANAGSVLVTINLPADWMNAAGSGQKTLLGSWVDATADGSGTAAHFRVFSSQATKDGSTCFMQGSVGQGTGDLSLDNTTIVAGQQVTVTAFTLNEGNA